MKDLSEAAVTILLAFCGVAICYWVLGEWLIAMISQSLGSIRP